MPDGCRRSEERELTRLLKRAHETAEEKRSCHHKVGDSSPDSALGDLVPDLCTVVIGSGSLSK